MKKKKATPKSSPNKTPINSNSMNAQRQRVMQALKTTGKKGLTTIQLRENHDVMMPAARVHELRWSNGHNIQTIWSQDINAQGNKHKVARYVLLSGKWEESAG